MHTILAGSGFQRNIGICLCVGGGSGWRGENRAFTIVIFCWSLMACGLSKRTSAGNRVIAAPAQRIRAGRAKDGGDDEEIGCVYQNLVKTKKLPIFGKRVSPGAFIRIRPLSHADTIQEYLPEKDL